jgi:hypothetical protein
MKLLYNATDFPLQMGSNFTGWRNCTFTRADLVWAAITVGRQSWSDVIQYQQYSYLEMLYRTIMLRANLDVVGAHNRRRYLSEICATPAFRGLDPSEKGAISYFVGLTIAKLFADDLLGVPWLMHLDKYRRTLLASLRVNERPDLVGLNQRQEWIVVEAKGRSGYVDTATLDRAKQQTRSLRSIAGRQPALRMASASYFTSAGILRLSVQDPDDFHPSGIDMDLLPEQAVRDYYQPFVDLIRNSSRVETHVTDARQFRTVGIPEVDMWVGVDEEVMKVIDAKEKLTWHLPKVLPDVYFPLGGDSDFTPEHPDTPYDDFEPKIPEEQEELEAIGGDGILVLLGRSWLRE